jgi:hypothetical protein
LANAVDESYPTLRGDNFDSVVGGAKKSGGETHTPTRQIGKRRFTDYVGKPVSKHGARLDSFPG